MNGTGNGLVRNTRETGVVTENPSTCPFDQTCATTCQATVRTGITAHQKRPTQNEGKNVACLEKQAWGYEQLVTRQKNIVIEEREYSRRDRGHIYG